jgi:molybdate-binding protein
MHRLVPSVAAAMALARCFECRVEDLFGAQANTESAAVWAWPPAHEPCRYWQARVRGRTLYFPAEWPAAGNDIHDGVCRDGRFVNHDGCAPENTLVMASCDPAAALLAQALAQAHGFRLLVFQRSSRQALDLLQRGLVDVAGMHLARADEPDGNAATARNVLGKGYSLLKYACWQEGLALGPGVHVSSPGAVVRAQLRWVGREPGSGARQCQDELLARHKPPRRLARHHRGVAEAVSAGWAEVGVCVRLVCEEAGLNFLEIQDESYDLCFPTELEDDPRLRALLRTVRAPAFRTTLAELPGYDSRATGEVFKIG